MKARILIPSSLACAVLLAACTPPAQEPAASAGTEPAAQAATTADAPVAPAVDMDQLADRIVTQSAGVSVCLVTLSSVRRACAASSRQGVMRQ